MTYLMNGGRLTIHSNEGSTMDLDSGIRAARGGRWSKWWAEARSLAAASNGMCSKDGEGCAFARSGESNLSAVKDVNGRLIADEFLTLLSNSRAYVLLMDPSYRILAANRSFRESEIPAENPEGANFMELLEPESQIRARLVLETMCDRPCLIELSHRHEADVERRVSYCFCRTGDFGESRIIAVGRDQEDPLELVEHLVRLNSELEESRHELSTDDMTDELTGLGNRRWLFERLNVLWREANRQGTLVWVMMADLDQFHKFNQTHGQESGDKLLKTIAAVLHNSIRAGDWVCRYGGDGFLLAGICTDESEMPGLAGRILSAIRGLRFEVEGKIARITISLGAALAYPSDPCQPWVVLQAADRAVKRAKEAGRDRYDVEPGVVDRPEGPSIKANARFR